MHTLRWLKCTILVPNHEVAKKQMRNFSGMLSFELKGTIENGVTLVEVS